jgi:O-antigen/teichoic acid export membrane protein
VGSVGRLLLRASGWLVAGALISRLATAAAAVVVSRLLMPRELGRLTLIQTAIALLAGLAGSAWVLGVARQVAETRQLDPRAAGRYLGVTVLLTAITGLAVTIIYLLTARTFCAWILRDASLRGLVPASSAAVALTAINAAFQSALVGLEAFAATAAAQLLLGFATAAGLILGASSGGARGALLGTAVAQLVAAVPTVVILHRTASRQGVRISYGFHRLEARRLFALGRPALAAFLAVAAAGIIGQVLLTSSPRGYQRLATFGVAYRWFLAMVFIPAALVPAVLPIMSRLRAQARPADALSLFRGTIWLTAAVAAVPAIAVAAGAGLLLRLNGAYYARDTLPLVILALAAVPCAVNSVLSSASVSLGAMREWLFSDLILAAVLVGMALWLVGPEGPTGLALAYLGSYLATDLSLALPVRRRLRASVDATTP